MRIGIDARTIATSTGRYVERLLTYLQEVDSANDYFVLVQDKDRDYWQPRNRNFHITEADYGSFGFSEQLGFLRTLNGLGLDLVHFCGPQFPVLYRGKFVSSIHDLTMFHALAGPGNTVKNNLAFRLKLFIYGLVFDRAVTKAKQVITPTEATRAALIDRVGKLDPAKVHVTYYAADLIPHAATAMPGLEGKDFLLYVGRAWPYKNIGLLIDAFGNIKKKHPRLRLALVGQKEANYEQLQAHAAQQGIEDVLFTGFVSESQLRWLYENASAYVFPSFSEGFGLPGLEAMRHGAPVLASNATCLPEVYGQGARYFDPCDCGELEALINELVNNEHSRAELIAHGHEQCKRYSWLDMARQTHAIYMRACNR